MCLTTININNIGRYTRGRRIVIVDLRDREDFNRGHIPGAVNIPYGDIDKRKSELANFGDIFLYCDRGNVSLMAARRLSREGYRVINLYGGIHSYRGKLVL